MLAWGEHSSRPVYIISVPGQSVPAGMPCQHDIFFMLSHLYPDFLWKYTLLQQLLQTVLMWNLYPIFISLNQLAVKITPVESFLWMHLHQFQYLFCNVVEVGSLLIWMMFVLPTYFEYWYSNSRSFICTTNKITPKRVPGGAPPHSWSQLDCDLPILTCCCRAVRKAAIQRSKSAGVPISDSFRRTI